MSPTDEEPTVVGPRLNLLASPPHRTPVPYHPAIPPTNHPPINPTHTHTRARARTHRVHPALADAVVRICCAHSLPKHNESVGCRFACGAQRRTDVRYNIEYNAAQKALEMRPTCLSSALTQLGDPCSFECMRHRHRCSCPHDHSCLFVDVFGALCTIDRRLVPLPDDGAIVRLRTAALEARTFKPIRWRKAFRRLGRAERSACSSQILGRRGPSVARRRPTLRTTSYSFFGR